MAFCPLLRAQTPPIILGGQNWYITGYVLTTTPVSVCSLVSSGSLTALPPTCSQIVWWCGGDLNAAAGTAATITLKDGNGGYYWNAIAPLSATAASSFNIQFSAEPGAKYGGCRPFPSGLLVSASIGGVVTFSGHGVY